MGRLDGKTAVVTGANSGMGMATVEALSDEGAAVIMLCRDDRSLIVRLVGVPDVDRDTGESNRIDRVFVQY